MPALMMGNRELRNVPADFDTPIGETWAGWFRPAELREIPCGACAASGWSPTARWLQSTFWGHNVGDGHGWRDRLTQQDVDHLADRGAFRVRCGWSLPTARNPQGRAHWLYLRPTADEVNEATRSRAGWDHPLRLDSSAEYRLTVFRCGLLGASVTCGVCDGEGCSWRDAEHKAAWEAWDPQPPTGDHIQLWQTVSEGGPVSPVFPDDAAGRRDLARWMVANDTSIHRNLTEEDWLRVMGAEFFATEVGSGELVIPGAGANQNTEEDQ